MITVTADTLDGIRRQVLIDDRDVIMVLRARPHSWRDNPAQGPKPQPGCIIDLFSPFGEVPLLFENAGAAVEWIEKNLKERDADVERALANGRGLAPR